MKLRSFAVFGALLAFLLLAVKPVDGQGTAFTYQGRLNQGGAPASGQYQLNFSLWSAISNGTELAGPIDLSAVSVSNGLFTVTLDFGPGVFLGNTNWLEIDVATNGAEPAPLTPRQPITPTPYAIMAESASNLLGGVSLGQLPSSVVTNNNGGNVTFSGLTLTNLLTLPSTSASPDRILSGSGLLLDADSNANLFLGQAAGNLTLTGNANTGIARELANERDHRPGQYGPAGYQSMDFNTTGAYNAAFGLRALFSQAVGYYNTALGLRSLYSNYNGSYNTGAGAEALYNNNSGSNNIALGFQAGSNVLGSSNIDLGNAGTAADNNIIRIGAGQTQTYLAGLLIGNGGGLTNLATTNLVGALAAGQLPSGVLTNGATGVALNGSFTGDGSGLTNLTTSNLIGILSLAQLPAGVVTASNGTGVNLTGSFSGDGSGLTNLAASNLVGTLPLAQLPGSILTSNNLTNLTLAGTFSGNGAGLSNVPAAQLSSGVSIGAGSGNSISSNSAAYGFIGGGWNNTIQSGASEAFIGGGEDNTNGGTAAAIGGGSDNLALGNNATIPGGFNNEAWGSGSFAAGQFATADNSGSFVWSDGTRAVSDPAANTFVASATGGFYFQTAANSQVTISTNGTLSTPVLTITGGSDVAEPFHISGDAIHDGAVVIIDENHPGQLKLSDRPYDTRVAGVVSGANGIHPGIQMQQQGLLEGGRNVALTGRVYVQADDSNGSIHPGDLLTTSARPGYAMKVTDHHRAQGAVLGKAMTGLNHGNGMVLVLVTLQ